MVFGGIWNFIKRHRRKFVYAGVFITGSWTLLRYLRWKLQNLQEKQLTEAYSQARRQQHFDANQRTCCTTINSLIPTLRQSIMQELDCESLTSQLQQRPANKVHIWSELNFLAFTRALSAVYGTSLLVNVLRLQLNIIGGSMYSRILGNGDSFASAAESDNHRKYLEAIQYFLQTGIINLIDEVRPVVERELLGLSLKQILTLDDFKAIINSVRRGVKEMQLLSHVGYSDRKLDDLTNAGDLELRHLFVETREIMASTDFQTELQTSISSGFEFLCTNVSKAFLSDSSGYREDHCRTVRSMALAKLIPPVSGAIYRICSESSDGFVQELLKTSSGLEFAHLIYQAFSQPSVST